MPDPSTANPSEPDNPGQDSGSKEEPKRRLKLKRIVIEDVEIHPHKNPNTGPTPEAQPYEEPEELPVPKDLTVPPFPIPPEATVPPGQEEPANPEEGKEEGQPEEVSDQPGPGEPKEPEINTPRGSKWRMPVVFLIILGIGAFFVWRNYFATGEQPSKIAVDEKQAGTATVGIPESEAGPQPILVMGKPLMAGGLTPDEFMDHLQSMEINASVDPTGIFVAGVFIPQGQSINPELDLTLESVTFSGPQPVANFSTPGGGTYSVTAIPAKK